MNCEDCCKELHEDYLNGLYCMQCDTVICWECRSCPDHCDCDSPFYDKKEYIDYVNQRGD